MLIQVRTRRLAAAALTTVGFALAACGSSSYPANVQTNFLNACETNGSLAYCDCTLSQVEAHVSLGTFQTADAAINAGDTNYPSWLLDAATACRSKE
jgi:hypothetical protein